MGIATALGNTFIMPQAQPQQRGQQAGSGQQDGGQSMLGQLPTGMQNIEGITDELYNSWGKLEQFAQDMKIRFGIDVTRPDFSSEEAMQAHKTFQKAHAALLYKANRLTQAQKDMDKYNSQIMGTQGNRYGYQGDPNQEIFDPNKVTVAESEKQKYSGLSPEEFDRRERLKSDLRLKEIAARAADKKKAGETTPDLEQEKFIPYHEIMTQAVKAVAGDVDWYIDPETGRQMSDFWQGRQWGRGGQKKIINGLERDPESGDIFLVYGEDDEKFRLNEENVYDLFENYIFGQGSEFKGDVATTYESLLKDVEGGAMSLAPETSSLSKAEAQWKEYESGEKAKIADEILDNFDSYKAATKDTMNEVLQGKSVTINGEEKTVSKVEKSNLAGQYKISFNDGESVRVGGGKDNDEVIKNLIKETLGAQQEATQGSEDGATYTYKGAEYTEEELFGMEGFSDELFQQLLANGQITKK
jgi:hypothetical protein